MKVHVFAAAGLSSLALLRGAAAVAWSLTTDIAPDDFASEFSWGETRSDNYTHGLVTYQNFEAAQQMGLSGVRDGEFFLGVSTQQNATEGRPSVRIESRKSYHDGVYVLNFTHVPTGCSTWPAFWTTTDEMNAPWPAGGEIDILENANDQYASNLVSLHTSSSCAIAPQIDGQTGQVFATNCSAYAPGNSGCRVETKGTSVPTWGAELNAARGGFVAMARELGSEGKGIRTWFWPRGQEPFDLRPGSMTVDPDRWGAPGSWFNIAKTCGDDFWAHKIVLDITLGGDWAAATYAESGCEAKHGSITDQVVFNGSSYSEAYWSIGDLRLFNTGGGTAGKKTNSDASSGDKGSMSASRTSSSSSALNGTFALHSSLALASLMALVVASIAALY